MKRTHALALALIATSGISAAICFWPQKPFATPRSHDVFTSAEAEIKAFETIYPEHSWTHQAADEVMFQKWKLKVAKKWKREAENSDPQENNNRLAFSYAIGVSMRRAEKLMFCERYDKGPVDIGGVSWMGYGYRARKGFEEQAKDWCPS